MILLPTQTHERYYHPAWVHTTIVIWLTKPHHDIFMHQAWLHTTVMSLLPKQNHVIFMHQAWAHTRTSLNTTTMTLPPHEIIICMHQAFSAYNYHDLAITKSNKPHCIKLSWLCLEKQNHDRFMHRALLNKNYYVCVAAKQKQPTSLHKTIMSLLSPEIMIDSGTKPHSIKLSWCCSQSKKMIYQCTTALRKTIMMLLSPIISW